MSALLEHREAEKDHAARGVAAAQERVEQARRTIADVERRARRVRESIGAGTLGSRPHALRDAYELLEHLRLLGERAADALDAAQVEFERQRALGVAAARAWKRVDMLRARAAERRAAYELQLDEQAASEANLALATRLAELDQIPPQEIDSFAVTSRFAEVTTRP